MGCVNMFSSCSGKECYVDGGSWSKFRSVGLFTTSQPSGNPKPDKFRIEKYKIVSNFLVVLVHYPDCQNYEGQKILVFKDLTVEKLHNLRLLDPHFCNSPRHPSPVARFEPTDRGWQYAVLFCRAA